MKYLRNIEYINTIYFNRIKVQCFQETKLVGKTLQRLPN